LNHYLIISIFVAGFAHAQTDDFSIKQSKQWEYIRVNGNPEANKHIPYTLKMVMEMKK